VTTAGSRSIKKSKRVKIGILLVCKYYGGNSELGNHGHHFWIDDGRLGHGELALTHSIPLSDVTSIEVTEREVGGSDPTILIAQGMRGGRGIRGSDPKQVTDIVVRTRDGQSATWVVQRRSREWVREKLSQVLRDVGIPFYGDLPPRGRTG
jgi:hypothetical protein